ncbi:YncE family protein [Luteibaculum oceani]|uniref:YncE family protein n=1 Tax=Luteibaculum oceani TaxID=1294296 RepID=A0A5C6USG0_9FLAO|nr:DUF5074 domain-containing protein [Luteibaculum oceani]TXC75594.1 hypothetical protein FRX97_11805 [Luteibaculum oceani]
MRFVVLLICSVSIFFSCKSENPNSNETTGFLNHNFLDGLWVANEGNFTFGNASLSHVKLDSNVINDAFQKVNGLPVGDVLQSVNVIGDYLFLVVNNSGKIHVCDKTTLKLVKTITGFVSPRYIAKYNQDFALVSDLYSENITVVNLNTLEKDGEIHGSQSSEKLLVDGDLIFTNTWVGSNTLRKIKWTPDGPKEIWYSYFPTSPIDIAYVQDKIWVACQAEEGTGGSLAIIEPKQNRWMTIDTIIQFSNPEASPNHLTFLPSKNKLAFISSSNPTDISNDGGVFTIDPVSLEISEIPIVPKGQRLFYSMEWSEERGLLYLTDAKDYLSPGELLVYNFDFQLEQTVSVGIIPGQIFTQ